MNFNDELKGILSAVEGARAITLMGFDGIPVAEAKSDGFEMSVQDTVIEFSRILSESLKVGVASEFGGTNELLIGTDRYRLLFRVLDANYFVALVLSPDASLGKGRYLLRRSLPAFRTELA